MVICTKCSKEIKTREELVVAPYFFIPKAYHRTCYSDILLKGAYPPLFKNAINISWARTILGLGIVIVLFVVYNLFLATEGLLQEAVIVAIDIFIFLFLIAFPIAERLYSHFAFESKLR